MNSRGKKGRKPKNRKKTPTIDWEQIELAIRSLSLLNRMQSRILKDLGDRLSQRKV